MAEYTRDELSSEITSSASGSFASADFILAVNKAVRFVVLDVDLRGSIRKSALSPNLFEDIFAYSSPSDLKGNKIIDIKPQIDRGRLDNWVLKTAEEFDRTKEDLRTDIYGDPLTTKRATHWFGENIVAVSEREMTKRLLLSRPIDDTETSISGLSSVGDWTAYGDGTNLTQDSSNYVKGSASINWDINADGGTTAGIVNSSLDSFDVSSFLTEGCIFVWAYVTDKTNLTNYKIRIGSGASAYYEITITTNNEGVSFENGWNLLRFDFVDKSTTGTPDDDGCDYVALFMTKDGAKISETDYRFDNLIMKVGDHYDVIYYSKYLWQSSAGTYLENSTDGTDLVNMDTDEVNLIELKTAEYIEKHLKNHNEAKLFKEDYMMARARYVADNQSEAMSLSQQYYSF